VIAWLSYPSPEAIWQIRHPDASNDIRLAQSALSHLNDLLEHLIPLRMAIAVVDVFEVIKVKVRNCKYPRMPTGSLDLVKQLVAEMAPIASPGH